MTTNQLEFAKIQETGRHNRVTERHEHRDVESRRISANAAALQAATSQQSLAETRRHNVETENINWFTSRENVSELQRHNRASEALSAWQNQIDEQYKKDYIGVQQRNAAVAERQANVSERNASTNWYNALTQARVAETQESNAYTNRLQHYESVRHNKASESLGYSQLSESVRHNQATEGIQSRQASVAERNALVNWGNLLETRKQTQVSKQIANAKQSEAETASQRASDYSREVTTREQMVNLQQQELEKDWYRAHTDRANAWTGGIRNISSAVESGTRAMRNITGLFQSLGGDKDEQKKK